jgi:pimeloyl-ACP methyl ester carboxylesterase
MSTLATLPELQLAQIPSDARPAYTGDRISYMEAGNPNAFPVVLLHGIGANSAHWRFQLSGLSRSYRVIAWNAPGYYMSDKFAAESPGPKDYAKALRYLVDWLGIERFHLVGNSFGSQVAACFTHFLPGYVQSIAMTGTSRGRAFLNTQEKAQTKKDRLQQISVGGFQFGSERWEALFGLNPDADKVELAKQVLRLTNPEGFLQAVRFGLALDTIPFVSDWEKPLLIIQGDADRVTPYELNGAKIVAQAPDCRVEHLAGIGHLPELEAPEEVNRLLLGYFAEHD